jgi:hypothetical protein
MAGLINQLKSRCPRHVKRVDHPYAGLFSRYEARAVRKGIKSINDALIVSFDVNFQIIRGTELRKQICNRQHFNFFDGITLVSTGSDVFDE